LAILAFTCGVAVSNVYFPQAITPLIADGLHVSLSSATLVATATQLGYAAGIFLFVPLGDQLRYRPLVTTLLVVTAAGLVVASTAQSLPELLAASVAIGASTVVAQVLMPVAAGHVSPDQRGAVTGTLLSGLLAGILLARTFSGTLGQWLGWRAPYLVASGLALACAAVLPRFPPATSSSPHQRYRDLLKAAAQLLRTEPALRLSAVSQAIMFGAFTAAWTSVALLLTGPTYGLGSASVGLVALVGAASVCCSPIAGRTVDRNGPRRLNLLCFVGALLAAGILPLAGAGGPLGFIGLVIGILVLDVAVQCGQVANQNRIFTLPGDRRSRLNTAYMTCMFFGGTFGSWLGVRAYLWLDWAGVCGLLAILAVAGLFTHLVRDEHAP
jgi:predicted MFS family arabinose efflux permease